MSKKYVLLATILGILSCYGCNDDSGDSTPIRQNNRCIKESDCKSGVCLNTGICADLVGLGENCDSTRICSKGSSCVDGKCAASDNNTQKCTSDADCRDGNVCIGGWCTIPTETKTCTKDADCPANHTCFEGVCYYKWDEFGSVGDYTSSDLAKSSAECRKAKTCMDREECKKGVNYAACLCAQGDIECRTYPVCAGIGKCTYNCGEGDSCSWAVCVNSEACTGQCIPGNLPANEDFDGDGIANDIELKNGKLDPCNADTDGDGIKDGDEDLNHDGIYQPEDGETDPTDPGSKIEPSTQEGMLAMNACKRSEVLSGGTTGRYSRFFLAKVTDKGYQYYTDLDIADTNVVRFESGKVVGFFGSHAKVIGTGQQLLASALDAGTYVEISAFKAAVPLASWFGDSSYGYQKEFQVVPDHTVDRYQYIIATNGKSLQEIADAIAKQLDPHSTAKYGSSTKCSGNAILYLARSTYEKGSVYSGAIACESDTKTAAVAVLMDDVASGTLVAPSRTLASEVFSEGFAAYEDFICQIEPYGNSAGKVDFLWVIDNSGSMADELEKLSKTIQLFGTSMKAYGIDFRAGVTTTDAYLLDEDPTAYKAYDETKDYALVLDNSTYLNGVGFKQHNDTLKEFRGFLDILSNGKLDGGKQNAFQTEVTRNAKCTVGGKKSRNICGFGYEDGLRSGAFTLSRIHVDLDEANAPDYYSTEDKNNWDIIKKIKAGVTGGDVKKLAQVSPREDENSLLYVIWVSDEESRQFKEEAGVAKPVNSVVTNPVFENSTGSICKTGYKLNHGTMRTGPGGDDLSASDCNPSMKDKLEQLIEDGSISEDSSMEELEAVYPEYADMLKYYIKQYQNYAQNKRIIGFALVGDAGRKNGGLCKPLAVCSDADCLIKDTDGSCLECTNWDYNSSLATVGANYGLSYIHMARFLSSYYPDNPDKATKEGGKASICADDYNAVVTAIAEDVVGRVGSHRLRGYPISSSIRVHRVKDGAVTEMARNAVSDGWEYDASQNAITFKNVQNIAITDSIAITYVIWKEY
ncbi:MAG: hypothetical protein J6A01_04485 [Proteobacteria bacterium]|nr:hypothetical protein [Pseudomonadota bacterium]